MFLEITNYCMNSVNQTQLEVDNTAKLHTHFFYLSQETSSSNALCLLASRMDTCKKHRNAKKGRAKKRL